MGTRYSKCRCLYNVLATYLKVHATKSPSVLHAQSPYLLLANRKIVWCRPTVAYILPSEILGSSLVPNYWYQCADYKYLNYFRYWLTVTEIYTIFCTFYTRVKWMGKSHGDWV